MSSCQINKKTMITWTINPAHIKELIGTSINKKKNGLLFLDIEVAGLIQFNSEEKCNMNYCDKTTTSSIKSTKGKKDSVMTPLGVINFHTHPLSCYIEAETIWGWPSGEDLSICIDFAEDSYKPHICHIIFAVEGTYIIEVNKSLLDQIKKYKSLLTAVKHNINNIFQLTHKYRMYYNDNKISLEQEFYKNFLQHLSLQPQENILKDWLLLVNKMNINNLNILSNIFKKLEELQLKVLNNLSYSNINSNIPIFNVTFVPNKVLIWNKSFNFGNTLKSKEKLYNIYKKNKNTLSIKLPAKGIQYKANWIPDHCI